MNRIEALEMMKTHGRLLMATLFIFGASIAPNAFAKDTYSQNNVPWQASAPIELPNYAVHVSNSIYAPTYTLISPSGEKVEFSPTVNLEVRGLPVELAKQAAEESRVILEAAARLLLSQSGYSLAAVNGRTAHVARIDPEWLRQNNLTPLDPLRLSVVQPAVYPNAVDQLAVDAKPPSLIEARIRIMPTLNYLRDAIYGATVRSFRAVIETRAGRFVKDVTYDSTIQARDKFRDMVRQNRSNPGRLGEEVGIHVLVRAGMQIGAGVKAVMLTLPISFSIGYNRKTRIVSFRRGIRTEKMVGGTAFGLTLQADVKMYKLNPEVIDAGDPRPGFGALRGETWLPPSVPFLAIVAESAPGYDSKGASFAWNLADLAGMSFMNTRNGFSETQKVVYSAPMPNPMEWMRRLQEQVSAAASVFDSPVARGGRCELVFKPVFVSH